MATPRLLTPTAAESAPPSPSPSPATTTTTQKPADEVLYFCPLTERIRTRHDIEAYLHTYKSTLEVVVPPSRSEYAYGVAIISPLLNLALIVAGVWAIARFPIREEHLLNHEELCPCTALVKRQMTNVDHLIASHLRPAIAGYCVSEDSFWRFFVNVYTRSLLSQSDSFPLLLSNASTALFGAGAIFLLIPWVAWLFAQLANGITTAEVFTFIFQSPILF